MVERFELMQHKVWFDESQGVLRLEVLDDFNSDNIEEMFVKVEELFEGRSQKLILVDISMMPNLSLDKKTRRLLQEKAVPFLAKVIRCGVLQSETLDPNLPECQ